jgi:hypothetical protein
MGPESDDLIRLALFKAWHERCVWCRIPLYFSEMEIDHVIPKSLDSENVRRLIAAHGLSDDFDLHSLENLAASCGPCNGGKSRKPPPEAPGITLVLTTARSQAPGIADVAQKLRGKRKLDEALAIVRAAAAAGDENALEALPKSADTVSTEFGAATGQQIERLHPALGLLYGEWTLVDVLSDRVATVTDGERAGYTGTNISFMCGNCGSYGPWNGVICLTCGQRSEPD